MHHNFIARYVTLKFILSNLLWWFLQTRGATSAKQYSLLYRPYPNVGYYLVIYWLNPTSHVSELYCPRKVHRIVQTRPLCGNVYPCNCWHLHECRLKYAARKCIGYFPRSISIYLEEVSNYMMWKFGWLLCLDNYFMTLVRKRRSY